MTTATGFTSSPVCPHCGSRDLDACHPAGRAVDTETPWSAVTCGTCKRTYQVRAYRCYHYGTRIVGSGDSGRSAGRETAGAGKMPRQQEKGE